jgi:hypothetical protein
VRLAFLVATAASVSTAAAVETTFDDSGLLFAAPLAVIFLMAYSILVSSTERGTAGRAATIRYSLPNVVAMAAVVASGFLEGSARYIAWIAATLIVVWSTVKAGEGEWTMRPGHFAERHGLIIIIAPGEVIVALGNAVVDPLSEEEGVRRHDDDRAGGNRRRSRVALVVILRSRPTRVRTPYRGTRRPGARAIRTQWVHLRPHANRRRRDPDRRRARRGSTASWRSPSSSDSPPHSTLYSQQNTSASKSNQATPRSITSTEPVKGKW